MPVRKYRDVSEMPDEVWHEPGSPGLLAAIHEVWAFAAATCPRQFPHGVYKHRSLEEAEAQRERWAREGLEAHWRRLGRPKPR